MSGHRLGLKIPPVPGVTTLVHDDSKKNLPTDLDREQQTNLPDGSATPRSPSSGGDEESKGEHTVEKPTYESNKPDNGIPERPRTLPTPGEDYGVPYKEDYNYVTRRTMKAEDEESEEWEKEAYRRSWRPGRRQRRSRGTARVKQHRSYLRNRNKEKIRARTYYRRNKNNPQFKKVQEHRRDYPEQHKRRMASASVVASVFLAASWEPPSPEAVAWAFGLKMGWTTGPVFPPDRQHKQWGQDKRRSQRDYRKNAPLKIHDALVRYHSYCKENARCKKRREMYRRYPNKYKRRIGSVLTTPQIAFVVGPDWMPGTVHSISPMTGAVTFVVHEKDQEPLRSMPVLTFLHSVIFLSDQDIDAFFELVDVEIGPEAYEDIDAEVVRECALLYQVDVESQEFADRCMYLTGKDDLEDMTPEELGLVNDRLVLNQFEGGEIRESEPEPKEMPEMDWHLYYGEVPEPEVPTKVAYGSDILLIDREAPEKERQYPDKGVSYTPSSEDDWTFTPHEDHGADIVRNDDDVPAASGKVVPPGDGTLWTAPKEPVEKFAATIEDLAQRTGPDVHSRARAVRVRLHRADPQRGIWTFQARGSKGETYTIRVKGQREGNVKDLAKAQILVSCDCNYFRWQGPEHWAKANDYLYGRPRGTASTPHIKDPDSKHWACKHVLAALNLARRYRFSSSGLGLCLDGEIMPDYAPSSSRVAARYLEGSVGMVGFSLARRHRPNLLAKIHACREYLPGQSGASGTFEEDLKVHLTSDGKKERWLTSGAFERALRPLAIKAMKDEGMFPKNPQGYSIDPQCIGMAEIGEWHEQNSYSDDSYIALRTDTPEIAKYVMEAISAALPVTGGGVYGARGYKGSGWSGSGTEWKYHYSSFGIGD